MNTDCSSEGGGESEGEMGECDRVREGGESVTE